MTLKELKSHVTVTRNGCWEWNRGKTAGGYGALRDGDKIRYAHIKAYELANGAVPKDFVVDHKCRNRKCVNPAHLKAKTRGENSTTNSDSPTAKNKAKKVCMNGHPLTGDNLYTMPDGRRQCRKCQNARIAAWRKKNPR